MKTFLSFSMGKLSYPKSLLSVAAASLALLAGCSDSNGNLGLTMSSSGADTMDPGPTGQPLVVTCASSAQPAPSDMSDPLYAYQWYLKNTGQQVFADTLPCAGVDLNIGSLHERGIRGRGVTVAIVDSGVDLNHEDLAANVVPGESKDFTNGSDPIDGAHGTNVAGILGAVGWNGLGGRGVAPEVSIKSFNAGTVIYGLSVANPFREYLGYSWGEGVEAKDVDVFNNSLGGPQVESGAYPSISHAELDSWEMLMRSTRNGRGGVYVFAGGNDFLQPPDILTGGEPYDGCEANQIGLSCVLVNRDYLSNFVPSIAVAAVNARGIRSYYSSAGSALWVSAFGGGDGKQQAFAGPDELNYDPGILTTDISGCAEGDNTSSTHESALDGGSALDPQCNYTASFGGTSAAAPMVAGIAALMLGVNPALTQRDVKYILANTARPLDLTQAAVTYAGTIVEPGWIKNAAGYRFSNWYGFGLVDASAAVAMATGFKSLSPAIDTGWITSSDAPSQIGGVGAAGTMTVNIDQNVVVEAVQFTLNSNHGQARNLLATLTSPSGTTSYVLTPLSNTHDGDNFTIPLSSSNAFFGEKSKGAWVLRLTDVSGNPPNAQLQSLQLRVVGHAAS